MTTIETAATMRRLAAAIEKLPGGHLPISGGIDEDCAVGAGAMLCYIRDLITTSTRDSYSLPELLVLLETISRDPDIFPAGVGTMMWAAEDE